MLWVLLPTWHLLRDVRTQQVVAMAHRVSQEFNECYMGMGRGCHPLSRVVTTQMGAVTAQMGWEGVGGDPRWVGWGHSGGRAPRDEGRDRWLGMVGHHWVPWVATTMSPWPTLLCPLDTGHLMSWPEDTLSSPSPSPQ